MNKPTSPAIRSHGGHLVINDKISAYGVLSFFAVCDQHFEAILARLSLDLTHAV